MNEEEVLAKVRALHQEGILRNWHRLSSYQKDSLLRQLGRLDEDLFARQQAKLATLLSAPKVNAAREPFGAASSLDTIDPEAGKKIIREGKTAVVILAGGQGSRLRFPGPKGKYPVTRHQKKSLFQLLAEKVAAASKAAGTLLEVAIMTSPINHVETQTFFAENIFFGLQPSQVSFFFQGMWPLLNFEKNLFLEEGDLIASGPNGNGSIYQRLVESGIWEKWKNKGIEIVQVLPVDNPLAKPFDPLLFAQHQKDKAEATLFCSLKKDAKENVGVLAKINEKTAVIEYTELDEAEQSRVNAQGDLCYNLANIGIYSFSLPFIRKVSQEKLPLHAAKKAVRALTNEGNSELPEIPNAWKFEEFIFDALPLAERVSALVAPREHYFAPLKNLKGEDSIGTVQMALLHFDQFVFSQITGKLPPEKADFELAPQFYYPTAELIEKWKGKTLPNEGYIHE